MPVSTRSTHRAPAGAHMHRSVATPRDMSSRPRSVGTLISDDLTQASGGEQYSDTALHGNIPRSRGKGVSTRTLNWQWVTVDNTLGSKPGGTA
jgi:hypothetical protein